MVENPHSIEDLERPSHLQSQHREWKVERVGWWAMGAIVGAALLGLLGPGPLTYRRSESPDGSLRVEYYLTGRYEAPSQLFLFLEPKDHPQGRAQVEFSRSFTSSTSPEHIVPEPESVQSRDNRTVYTFRISELGTGGKVVYRFKAEDFGLLRYQVGLRDKKPVVVRQFILP